MNEDNAPNQSALDAELKRIRELAEKEQAGETPTNQDINPQPVVTSQPEPVNMQTAPAVNIEQQPIAQPAENSEPQVTKGVPLPTLTPEGESKSSKTLIIIASILFVLSIIGIGLYYLGMKNASKKAAEAPIPLPTQVNTPVATTDPTLNWLTYSSSTYSVKYSTDITLKEGEGGSAILSKWGPTQKEGTELYDAFSLIFLPKAVSGTLESYVNSKIEAIEKEGVYKITSGPDPLTINNYTGLSYIQEGGGTFKVIVLQNSKKNLLIEIDEMVSDPGNLGFQKTVDQILSTFEFIESTATSSAIPSSSPTSSPSASPVATP